MRSIFKKDPASSIAADITVARDHRDKLQRRFDNATAKAADAKARVHQLLDSDSDDGTLTKAEAAHRGAEDAIAHRADALQAADRKLEALEQTQRDLIDAAQRKASLEQIERDRAALGEVQATFIRACAAYHEVANRIAPYAPECAELSRFMHRAPADIDLVRDFTLRAMDGWSGMIETGAAPAVLPSPEAPPAPVISPPAPEMIELIATHHLCWTDDNGHTRTSPRGHRVLLPKALAEHALSLTVAARFGSEAAKRALAGQWPSTVPGLEHCFALDKPATKAKDAVQAKQSGTPQRESSVQFTRQDRGPAYTATVGQ